MANLPSYHDALIRRLGTIEEIGQSATRAMEAQRAAAMQRRSSAYRGSSSNSAPVGTSGDNDPISFGRMLQKMGYRVSENPAFGGVEPVHTKNSRHYSGRAFDVNWGPGGTSKAEQEALARIVKMAQQRGYKSIFMAPGHYNHAHISW